MSPRRKDHLLRVTDATFRLLTEEAARRNADAPGARWSASSVLAAVVEARLGQPKAIRWWDRGEPVSEIVGGFGVANGTAISRPVLPVPKGLDCLGVSIYVEPDGDIKRIVSCSMADRCDAKRREP